MNDNNTALMSTQKFLFDPKFPLRPDVITCVASEYGVFDSSFTSMLRKMPFVLPRADEDEAAVAEGGGGGGSIAAEFDPIAEAADSNSSTRPRPSSSILRRIKRDSTN
jgi:hypothetical protein